MPPYDQRSSNAEMVWQCRYLDMVYANITVSWGLNPQINQLTKFWKFPEVLDRECASTYGLIAAKLLHVKHRLRPSLHTVLNVLYFRWVLVTILFLILWMAFRVIRNLACTLVSNIIKVLLKWRKLLWHKNHVKSMSICPLDVKPTSDIWGLMVSLPLYCRAGERSLCREFWCWIWSRHTKRK